MNKIIAVYKLDSGLPKVSGTTRPERTMKNIMTLCLGTSSLTGLIDGGYAQAFLSVLTNLIRPAFADFPCIHFYLQINYIYLHIRL